MRGPLQEHRACIWDHRAARRFQSDPETGSVVIEAAQRRRDDSPQSSGLTSLTGPGLMTEPGEYEEEQFSGGR